MKAAHDTLRRPGVVVLYKLRGQAEFFKLICPEGLGKEPPVIAKHIWHNDGDVAKMP
jgi:hypothetical protein